MTNPGTISHESYPDPHNDVYSKTIFGFWVYLLTDFMMFATLFAAYAVLHNSTFGGPSSCDIINLPYTFIQTLILLVCSFTSGIGGAFAHRNKKGATILFFIITFLLGIAFTGMEISELVRLTAEGSGSSRSAFLSAFFSLIGTHVAHMFFALLWVIILIIPVCCRGIEPVSLKRITCLRMFWQFLNIVWVFIFTIVYLLG